MSVGGLVGSFKNLLCESCVSTPGRYQAPTHPSMRVYKRKSENREILFLSQSEHIMDITDILNS
jgi:hypothetical protein